MRRALILLLTASVFSLAFYSCKPEEKPDPGIDVPEPPKDDPQKEDKPGAYKFIASAQKGTWEAGDKIYVHGKMGSWAEVVTLSASDISSDGKTATANLGEVTGGPADPDGLYAAWPDEAVKHINSKIETKTSFEDCDRLLTAAYLMGDTFTFLDVSSELSFTVSGDYDSYAICANNRDGIIVTNFQVDYSSKGISMEQKQNTGYPFKYGSVKSGESVRIWMPGDMTLVGGLTIFLGKNGQWPASYSVSSDVVLEYGKCKNLGDITSSVKAYDGPAPKMPQMGKSTKLTIKAQELSGLCLSEDQSFLWGVGDEGDLVKISFEGEVLYTFHIGGDTEDVSRNPETGDLIIALEPQGVGIVKGPDFNTKVSTLFNISACSGYGNSGLEGLTYYKNGKILAGAQHNSHLFLCDLASKKVIWEKIMYDKALVSEIAGLCYDPLTDWLWIIDSEAKKVFVFIVGEEDASMTLLGAYPVSAPGNPESVCVDHKNSCIWVGDDDGSTSYLYRYDFTGLDDAIIQ